MSETRRTVKRYHTRVVIPTDDVPDSASSVLVLIPEASLPILRYVLQYARRRINWSDEIIDAQRYYLPNDEKWDIIEELIDESENALMSYLNGDEVQAILEEMSAALQCLCLSSRNVNAVPGGIPDDGDIEGFGPLAPTDSPEAFSGDASDACAIGQLVWAGTWELMTEMVLPAARFGFDGLAPALAAVLIGWAGGPVAIFGIWIFAETIQELLELGYNSAEAEYTNWLFSVKDDLTCLIYTSLTQGGSDASTIAAIKQFVDDASSISAGDKLVTKLIAPGVYRAAKVAWAGQTAWALENVTAGACVNCGVPSGCFNFCSSGWTLYPVCTVTDCKATLSGTSLQYFAHRDISPGTYQITVDGKGAFNEEHYAFAVSVGTGGENANVMPKTYVTRFTDDVFTGHQVIASLVVAADSTVYMWCVSGTAARCDLVCLNQL